jgi:ElaB/YqjD/DUF883 family membrane-anchored ribosome-binding protein
MYHYTRRLYPGALHTRAGGIEFALSRGRDQIFQCYTVAGSKTQTVRKGREMASIHELQKTDTPMADAQSHDKPQTLSTQIQNAGTQVKETVQAAGTQVKETVQDMGTQAKETMQAAGTQVYEQGRESLQDLNRTIEGQIRQRPLQALLVAGGIGVLFGILWQRS